MVGQQKMQLIHTRKDFWFTWLVRTKSGLFLVVCLFGVVRFTAKALWMSVIAPIGWKRWGRDGAQTRRTKLRSPACCIISVSASPFWMSRATRASRFDVSNFGTTSANRRWNPNEARRSELLASPYNQSTLIPSHRSRNKKPSGSVQI